MILRRRGSLRTRVFSESHQGAFDSVFEIARIGTIILALSGGFSSAMAQPVETSKAQMRFGTEMAQRGLWNEALFRFKRALELDPDRAEIYNNLAVAYEALGLFDEALENYRKGLRLAPGDKGLKRNYARFVEFYQRFRPDEPAQSGSADETSSPPPEGPTANNGVDEGQKDAGSAGIEQANGRSTSFLAVDVDLTGFGRAL